jgi:hypothetical protein
MAFGSIIFGQISAQDRNDPEFLENSSNAPFQELDIFERYYSPGSPTASTVSMITGESGHGDFCFGHVVDMAEYERLPIQMLADGGYRSSNVPSVEKDSFQR